MWGENQKTTPHPKHPDPRAKCCPGSFSVHVKPGLGCWYGLRVSPSGSENTLAQAFGSMAECLSCSSGTMETAPKSSAHSLDKTSVRATFNSRPYSQ